MRSIGLFVIDCGRDASTNRTRPCRSRHPCATDRGLDSTVPTIFQRSTRKEWLSQSATNGAIPQSELTDGGHGPTDDEVIGPVRQHSGPSLDTDRASAIPGFGAGSNRKTGWNEKFCCIAIFALNLPKIPGVRAIHQPILNSGEVGAFPLQLPSSP